MTLTKTLCAAILAAFSTASSAGNFYIGGGLGFSNSDVKSSDIDNAFSAAGLTTNSNISDSNIAYQILAGYKASEYFSIEAAWLTLGDVDSNTEITAPGAGNANTSMEIDGFKMGIIAGKDVSSNVNLFATVGVFAWNSDVASSATINGSSSSVNNNDSGTDIYFGLGAGYQINQQFSLRAEWNRYTLNGDTNVDFDTFNINALYQF